MNGFTVAQKENGKFHAAYSNDKASTAQRKQRKTLNLADNGDLSDLEINRNKRYKQKDNKHADILSEEVGQGSSEKNGSTETCAQQEQTSSNFASFPDPKVSIGISDRS